MRSLISVGTYRGRMRYASPSRSAHRAASTGGLTVLLRPFPLAAGQHRHRPRRTRVRARPRLLRDPRLAALLFTEGLAALIVLGIATLVVYVIVTDERRSAGAAETPLAAAEVFPAGELRPAAGAEAYRVRSAEVVRDCAATATGTLRAVLAEQGCASVLRAGLTAPYGDYDVTAGIVQLPDPTRAAAVNEQVRQLVESGDGGFAPIAAEIEPGAAVVWQVRGHYLMYSVITRPGGEPLPTDDPGARRITAELLDTYLGETVLARRVAAR